MLHDPVHGTEELHAERCLEAFDEGRDPIEACKRVGPLLQTRTRLVDRAGEQFDGRLGAVLSVANSAGVVPFDVAQRLAKVVGIRAVVVCAELEP